jgi:hypothetical protein
VSEQVTSAANRNTGKGGDPSDEASRARPRPGWLGRTRERVHDILTSDDATVEDWVVSLSRARWWLAPLAFAVTAFTAVVGAIRLLFSNWLLTLVQLLPAMWVWAAMLDLKLQAFQGRSIHVERGPVRIVIVVAIAAVTAAAFFLNGVFAFAVAGSGPPKIRPAFTQARSHLAVLVCWGAGIGLLLGLSTVVAALWGGWWHISSLGAVIAIMMICLVAIPSRLIGVKTKAPRRDKLVTSALSGALGVLVCSPPYLLGRLGIVMLGSGVLFIPGVIVVIVGFILEAGATGAVKAIKMSAKLMTATPSTKPVLQ